MYGYRVLRRVWRQGTDPGAGVGTGTGMEPRTETTTETGVKTCPETGAKTGKEAVTETGVKTCPETGAKTRNEAVTETGTGPKTCRSTEAAAETRGQRQRVHGSGIKNKKMDAETGHGDGYGDRARRQGMDMWMGHGSRA